MLEGENVQGRITQKATKGYEAFQVDSDDENESGNNNQQSTVVRFIKSKPNQRLTSKEYYTCSIEQNGTIDKTKSIGLYLIMIEDGKCPFL